MMDYAYVPPPAKQFTLVRLEPLADNVREVFAVERIEHHVVSGTVPAPIGRWTKFFHHCIFGRMFSGEQGGFSWSSERTGIGLRTMCLTFRTKHGAELTASIYRAQYEYEITVHKDGEDKRIIVKDWDMRFVVTANDDQIPTMAVLYKDAIFR